MINSNSTSTNTPAPELALVARRTSEASLQRRLDFQSLLSEVSTHFINLPAQVIDEHNTLALGRVGNFLGFNLVAICKFSGQGSAGEVTHIWTAEGLPPIPPGFTELDFPWSAGRLTQGNAVHSTNLNDFPPEAQRDRQTYESLAIQSTYTWPLQVGGAAVGCLGFASVANTRAFPAEFEQGLELLTQVMASKSRPRLHSSAEYKLRSGHLDHRNQYCQYDQRDQPGPGKPTSREPFLPSRLALGPGIGTA